MIIEVKNISFSYNLDEIFKDVNFIINEGDKIGLVGVNGSGKSTLVKCLTGELEPQGKIVKKNDIKISILKQQITIDRDISVMDIALEKYSDVIEMEKRMHDLEHEIAENSDNENVLNDLYREYAEIQESFNNKNGYGYISEIKGYLSMVGLNDNFYDRNVMSMSGGEKARLELALVFMEKADLIILDEPTNHMDAQMINYLEKFMKDFKGSIIFISHDRLLLQNVATRIFEIEHAAVRVYDMGYDDYRNVRKKEKEDQMRHYLNFKKEEERQKEIIRRFRSFATERYHRLADSREKMLKRLKEEKAPIAQDTFSFNFKTPQRTGEDVLTVFNLGKSFPDKVLFSGICFEIKAGDRLAIMGPNGSGKSTLLKILLGEIPHDGEFLFGTGVKIGYFNQELVVNDDENTLIDEISDDYPKMTITEIRTKLGAFKFRGDDVFKQIKDLSGGERARVSLLKLILSGANVLFLDEPTNHLDIDSKEVLEEALLAFDGTIIFISHDRFFVKKIATKILDLSGDKKLFFDGDYDYYMSRISNFSGEKVELVNKTQEKKEQRKERERIKENQKLNREIKEVEAKIEECENSIASIDESLSNQEIYENHEEVLELSNKRNEIEKRLDEFYKKWEHLQTIKGEN